MLTFNRVVIEGHLGKNPEKKTVPSTDKRPAKVFWVFTVATAKAAPVKNPDGTFLTADWFDCVSDDPAFASWDLKQGSSVRIEGSFRMKNWSKEPETDKTKWRTQYRVQAERVYLIDEKDTTDRPPSGTVLAPSGSVG